MKADDLDQAYTALAQALTRAGEPQAERLLAILSLSLMTRQPTLAPVLDLIEQAETLARDHP